MLTQLTSGVKVDAKSTFSGNFSVIHNSSGKIHFFGTFPIFLIDLRVVEGIFMEIFFHFAYIYLQVT